MADDRCPICDGPLDDGRPVQTSLDGSAAHAECVAPKPEPEGEDADD